MITLRAFLVCSSCDLARGAFVINEGIKAPSVPAVAPPLTVVAMLDADGEHVRTKHEMQITIETPKGETAYSFPTESIVFDRTAAGERVAWGQQEFTIVDAAFNEAGLYWFRLFLDGFPIARASYVVRVDAIDKRG